ncbi:C4-dicarboxylate ABC transporter [Acidihalobacter aeolianus]|uniref:C4-dicarboxylate ABC transporter n=1 Tax=Acidihalobacter aeolianus TaxID=2792603 RepID=A0A1D8KAN3_9GAMM|nr:TDT family transporter [Acidihalobacter aeolianus]AOV18001.1 C4-dicarboxylate ABC transporter [Acidihalobacter aeolianus]
MTRAQRSLKDIIRHFTPNWFTMNMGTGILFLSLHESYPSALPGQDVLTRGLWLFDMVLYLIFTALLLSRFVLFPDTLGRLLRHPVQSMFLGAIPMGLVPILDGWLLFGGQIFGHAAVVLAETLWWTDAFLAVLFGWLVPYFMFTQQEHLLERMTAVWLLPIVSAEVTAAAGGLLARHLPPGVAEVIVTTSYVLWALSVPLALTIVVILFLRLVLHKLPHRDMAVSSWLVLGPLGTGSLGLLLLGVAAPAAFAGTQLASLGSLAYGVGVIGGLMLWGYGLWWWVMAWVLTLRYMREGLPFNMGWWGFTFPLGVYAAATLQLAHETGFVAFGVFGALLVVQLAGFWTVVTARTFHGMWHGYLFNAPCLSNESGGLHPRGNA